MPMMDLSDEQITAVIKQQGSMRKAAAHLGVPRSTLQSAMKRRGINEHGDRARSITQERKNTPRKGPTPRITRESLHAALQPPNTCTVKTFLDGLDEDDRDVVEEALGYLPRDFSASTLRGWLIELGFKESTLPTTQHITDHRGRRRPCRCDS